MCKPKKKYVSLAKEFLYIMIEKPNEKVIYINEDVENQIPKLKNPKTK